MNENAASISGGIAMVSPGVADAAVLIDAPDADLPCTGH
jgi:hypothetical protein